MPRSSTHIYIHFVWATWNRLPLITEKIENPVFACISAKCKELRCQLLEINGTRDHVHALARLHATVSVAQLAKEMKGASSHLITHEVAGRGSFKWQGSYGAFSVSLGDVAGIRAYVRAQKEHHARNEVVADWERCEELEDG